MKGSWVKGHQVDRKGSEPGPAEGRIDAEALFRAHAPFVAAFLHRLGTPQSEVDDLVQEVFLVAHRKGGYVPGAGQPRTWLAAIALRVARSGHRSRSRRREAPEELALDSLVYGGKDPGEALEIQKSLARVQQALQTLDLEHRAAFVLYEIEGEPCETIAASFDVPVGTIYSRLHHARRRFLEAYSDLGQEGPNALRPRLAEGA
jgi:RNA polymerase sigma-70 factor (ECF subfamily)